jgi:small nuclear ribonucleoprotein (snRNP)-like protein
MSTLIDDFLYKDVIVEAGAEKISGVLIGFDSNLSNLGLGNIILQNTQHKWLIIRNWEMIKS